MMTNGKPDKETKDHAQRRELVSSLADGQLRGLEFARAVGLLSESGDARATWHAYHVVGDVLRCGDAVSCADDAAFVARFQTRLQREISGRTPNIAPDVALNAATNHGMIQDTTNIVADNAHATMATGANGISFPQIESANESRFRWKLLAGVASLAAVGAVGWSLLGGLANWDAKREGELSRAPSLAPQPAKASPQVQAQPLALAQAEPQVMIRDPHLDALLAAHNQFGGTSALQMPAGFLRNATFEGPAR